MTQFERNIRRHVELELETVRRNPAAEFSHLERAHVLAQGCTRLHVRAHWHMLVWALRHRDARARRTIP